MFNVLVLVWEGGKMETLHKELNMVEKVLNRYAERLGVSYSSLSAASYIAMKRCYRGEGYKNSIRVGKQILDNHYALENEYE